MFKCTMMKKVVVLITGSCFLVLSVISPVYSTIYDLGSDDVDDFDVVVGFTLTGTFDLNSFSINSFCNPSRKHVAREAGMNNISFLPLHNSPVHAVIPLLTFGDGIEFPGLLYNQNTYLFHGLASEGKKGEKKDRSYIWWYVLGGAALLVGIQLLIKDEYGHEVYSWNK